jgi:CRISPR-associated endoribonuclease Cas6
MPYSLVLNLMPMSSIQPGYLQGKHLHALFLTLVSSVDRELGDRLHAQQAEKAFTLSPLQTGRQVRDKLRWTHSRAIAAGHPCWWRISLLDDDLFGRLRSLWLNLNPERSWHLGSANLQITSVLGTPQSMQPWAGFAPYSQLYGEASQVNREIRLLFSTPTAFRQGQYDTALPTRETVFMSLLRRWNEYSGLPFSDGIIEHLFPSFFDVRTEVAQHYRSSFIGCVGQITFQVLGDVDAGTVKQLNTLADFALYAGVGRKTPMGMGMTRRIGGSKG